MCCTTYEIIWRGICSALSLLYRNLNTLILMIMKTLNDYTNQEIIDLINNAKIACFAYASGSSIKVCYRASKKNIITIENGEFSWVGSCAAGVTAIKSVLGIE